MIRKLIPGAFALLILGQTAWSQNPLANISTEIHGFIKSDYWWDTRGVAGAREDLFALYPLAPLPDSNLVDVHGNPGFNFSAITSRINFTMKGPEAFGARSSAFIEADFSGTGNPDIDGFRLRHAYLRLDWENSSLLLGQFWHPMFVTEVFPTVISLNTGAPFQPFIRNPQVRYTLKKGDLEIIGALLSQRDYANEGPEGRSNIYIRRTGIPNAHLQMKLHNGPVVAGIAGDYKVIQPRELSMLGYASSERLGSFGLMAYMKHKGEKSSLSMKSIYSQNMSEHLLMGGYAVATVDTITGIETYTPTNHLSFWANYVYGKEKRLGMFAGYVQNLGTSAENTGTYYSRGSNIDKVYRFTMFGALRKGPVELCLELEYTQAWYGTPDKHGIVKGASEVSNLRTSFTAFYYF